MIQTDIYPTFSLLSALVFMLPTSEEVEGAYWFGSVRAVQ